MESIFFIAEIGGNHEGDIDKARNLMHLAIDAGADSIKFQVYSGESLANIKEDPKRVGHFNNFAFSDNEYVELAKECVSLGVDFNASIWNERQIDLLDPYMTFYKIGSGDLTAFNLIKTIVSKKKPIVLSTGLSTLAEIANTIEFICSQNKIYRSSEMISILQCTSMYPIPDYDANLNVLNTLRETFPYPVGYSDHTEGERACEIAIALGAKIIEVHFTDDRKGKEFRDHRVSFTSNEFKKLKSNSKTIKKFLGSGIKKPMPSEIKSGHVISFRRALYPIHKIKKGQVISESDLISLRPMHGIPANNLMNLVGKRATKDISKLSVLSYSWFK